MKDRNSKNKSNLRVAKQININVLLFIGGFAIISMTKPVIVDQDPWVAPKEYQSLENPFKNVNDVENLGRRLYSKNCQPCHGKTGKGDGKTATLSGIEMIDFTDGIIENQSDGSIFYKMIKGREFMPSFKVKLSDDEEKWLIINYLRNLVKK